jgi:phage/plasmid primase-like uncharacterized protein
MFSTKEVGLARAREAARACFALSAVLEMVEMDFHSFRAVHMPTEYKS